ncbi:MAG: MarR family transcriptional regulator [Lewinellaceae bacterium]|nr:MarR family transcriptional regulator [Saprospiraceae bacterium]MCB9332278.1 MarR family transcriptional regulator [Lewinellaceae bacterium]
MNIEAELKSTKPIPPKQRALLNILFTASWLSCHLQRQLRNYNLSLPQYNILRILNGSYPKGLSVLDIKGRMIDRSSNVSRLVEKLRENGYVDRVAHSGDRRMVVVSISEQGKTLLSEVQANGFVDPDKMPGNKLSEAEATELAHLLDRFRG